MKKTKEHNDKKARLFIVKKTPTLIFFAFITFAIFLSDLLVYRNQINLFHYMGINDDSAVYLYQANLLSHGVVKYQIPENLSKFFGSVWFFVNNNNALYSKYYPGYALSLVPWVKLNLPLWSYCVLINTFIIIFSYKLLSLFTSKKLNLVCGVLLFTFCPSLILFNSMILSYSLFTLLTVAGVYFFLNFFSAEKYYLLLVSSTIFGYSVWVRPYEGVIVYFISLVFLCTHLIMKQFPLKKMCLNIFCFGLPAFLFALMILCYNKALNGSYFLAPFQKYAQNDTIGFGKKGQNPGDSIAVDYTIQAAWEKTKVVFHNFFLPNVFGNFLLGIAATLLLIFNFLKKFDNRKLYLVVIIAAGFLADFFHWIFEMNFHKIQGDYPYLLFIIPLVFVLLATFASKQGVFIKTLSYSLIFIILASYPLRYTKIYDHNKDYISRTLKNELGRKYDKNDKTNSIFFVSGYPYLLAGKTSFIIPNDVPLASEPIVALDLGEFKNEELLKLFPDKKAYIIHGENFVRIR